MDLLQYIQFPATIAATEKLEGYGSQNYKVTLANKEIYLVKIYPASEQTQAKEEERIIALLQPHLNIALPVSADFTINAPNDVYIRVSPFITGSTLTKEQVTDQLLQDIAATAANMLRRLHTIKSPIIKAREHDWNLRDYYLVKPMMQHITNPSQQKIVAHYFDLFEQDVLPAFRRLRHNVIYGDFNEANIIIDKGELKGVIDFGDISYAPVVCELAILLTYMMMMFPENCFEKAKIIIQQFHQNFPLSEEELELLPNLIALRTCVSVCKSANEKAANQHTDYILISEQPAWHLLNQWITLNPLFIVNEFKRYAGFKVDEVHSDQLLERRKKVAAPSLSLSYTLPIHMSTALFQYMYDAHGGTYLDAYNNIPHVGHSHPLVAEAAAKQMHRLNTNTRYLYDIYTAYSENLLSLFPHSLNKAMLVNSGSEASDLATRVARTVSERQGIAVMEWSYHGNTQNGIYISSYKFDRKGGKGPADWVLRLPLPKAYQGKYSTAAEYVEEAKKLIEAFETKGTKLGAFIAEPISGCGGQVPLIEGYLQLLVPYLKQKGIIVIIDEVQTGFGRLGHWFWGFEMHGIVPDMVVLGKPIGNGFPMGAVITTSAITNAFNNGMEFFSSFGGNPVSCEVGNAVINIIRNESLQQNAAAVGDYWIEQLKTISKQYPFLGDVRGSGLFLGVECIDENKKENTKLAQVIKNKLKDAYILASTDGPLDNVLKMKPPLCLTKENVDQFMNAMHSIMQSISSSGIK